VCGKRMPEGITAHVFDDARAGQETFGMFSP